MALALTRFDGVAINGDSPYTVILPAKHGGPRYQVHTSLRERSGLPPTEEDFTYAEVTLECLVYQNGSAYSTEAFSDLAHQLFAWKRRVTVEGTVESGARRFVATVKDFYRKENAPLLYCLVLEVTDPLATAVSPTISTTSPVTVTGPVRALPLIRISPASISANPSYRRVTVTDQGQVGLSNYPVRITFDSTTASATGYTNYLALVNGQSVPFRLANPNNSATTMDMSLNVPPGGSSYVDLFYGGVVGNIVTADDGAQGIYDDRGMDLASGSWSNTSWVWNDFQCSLRPDAPGAWRLGKMGKTISGVSFGVVQEGPYGIAFGVRPDASLAGDADCMILTVGSRAAAVSALANLARHLTITAGTARSFVKYRTRNMSRWVTAWSEDETSPATSNPTTLNETLDATETGVDVVSASLIDPGRVIRVQDEDMYVVSKATNTLTVVRGFNGTTAVAHAIGAVLMPALSDAVSLEDAVQIAVGIEPLDSSASATLGLSSEGTFYLDIDYEPAVSVGSRSNACRLDGELKNARNLAVIEFDELLVGGTGELIIDCEAKRIRTVGDLVYTGNPLMTDGLAWWPLEPGQNDWSKPSGTTVQIEHRERAWVA